MKLFFPQSREEESVKSQIEAEGRENEERRAQFANAVKEEEQSKKKEKEALIDDLVGTFCVSVLGCWWHKSLSNHILIIAVASGTI